MASDQTDSAALARLLFMLFVHITDVDKSLSPYDIQRLIRLLENPRWMNNPLVRSGLERLRPEYSTMWASYDSAAMPVNLPLISRQLDTVLQPLPNEVVESVRVALGEFIQKFGVPVTQRLGRMRPATAASKDRARDELKLLITSYGKSLATAAQAAAPAVASPPSDQAARARDAALLAAWPAAVATLGEARWWTGARTRVRCVHVAVETHDVKTFAFATSPPELFRYRPGQFVTLELEIGGQTVRRSYTLSSSPTRPYLLMITVKRVPDGVVSNWLHDNMVEGAECHLGGPFGQFSCFDHPNPRLLMVSGGSGITPVMSMLRWLNDTRSNANVVFINNVRTPDDIIFKREMQHIAATMGPALQMLVVPGRVEPGQAWNGPVGVMSEQLLRLAAPDLIEREVFVCGPAGYMTVVKSLVIGLGLPPERFHQESFGAPNPVKAPHAQAATPDAKRPGTTPRRALAPTPTPAASRPAPLAAPAAPAATANGRTYIQFERSGKRVDCSAQDSILEIAEREGVPLPSACRAGTCGTCRVRKLGGQVEMGEQQVLGDADLMDGFVLACVGRPQGHVVIDA